MLLRAVAITGGGRVEKVWGPSTQQSAFLFMTLCSLVAIAVINAHHASKWEAITTTLSLTTMLGILNLAPLIAWIATTYLILQFGDCNETHLAKSDGQCDSLKVLLDAIGIISGRLARIDLGITLSLSANGAWLPGITNGYSDCLKVFQCIGLLDGGVSCSPFFIQLFTFILLSRWWLKRRLAEMFSNRSLNEDDDEDGEININVLGLVNCFGVMAFVLILLIALFGLPVIRKSWYLLFQRTHLHFRCSLCSYPLCTISPFWSSPLLD